MELGILGTGRMAVRLADLAAKGGHTVVLGSRTPERAQTIAAKLGGGVRGGSYEDALAAPAVLPALFMRDGAFDTLKPLRAALAGKVVIDVLNPFDRTGFAYSTGWDTSAAEELQKILPESRIVSIFKWPYWEAYENPDFDGGQMDVVYTGDDEWAKAVALDLFKAAPFRFLDGGPLVHARFTERMTLFAGLLGDRLGYLPRVGWRLLGEPWTPKVKDAYAEILAG
jgi:hypothetical protein